MELTLEQITHDFINNGVFQHLLLLGA